MNIRCVCVHHDVRMIIVVVVLLCSGAACDGCYSGVGGEGSKDTSGQRWEEARDMCH